MSRLMAIADCEYDALDRSHDGWVRAYHGTGRSDIRTFRASWGDIGPHFGTPLAANRSAEESFMRPPFVNSYRVQCGSRRSLRLSGSEGPV